MQLCTPSRFTVAFECQRTGMSDSKTARSQASHQSAEVKFLCAYVDAWNKMQEYIPFPVNCLTRCFYLALYNEFSQISQLLHGVKSPLCVYVSVPFGMCLTNLFHKSSMLKQRCYSCFSYWKLILIFVMGQQCIVQYF